MPLLPLLLNKLSPEFVIEKLDTIDSARLILPSAYHETPCPFRYIRPL